MPIRVKISGILVIILCSIFLVSGCDYSESGPSTATEEGTVSTTETPESLPTDSRTLPGTSGGTGVIEQPEGSGVDIVARINNHSITRHRLESEFERYKTYLEMNNLAMLDPPDVFISQKTTALIDLLKTEYVYFKSTELGIPRPTDELDGAINEIRAAQVPPGASDTEFEDALKFFDPSMTIARLRELIERDLLWEDIRQAFEGQVMAEIAEEKTLEAGTVRDEILSGMDFSDAAMEYSAHYMSKEQGGLI
ncbi:MAG: hypothetical protein ABIG42_05540, partial [bacterium]